MIWPSSVTRPTKVELTPRGEDWLAVNHSFPSRPAVISLAKDVLGTTNSVTSPEEPIRPTTPSLVLVASSRIRDPAYQTLPSGPVVRLLAGRAATSLMRPSGVIRSTVVEPLM